MNVSNRLRASAGLLFLVALLPTTAAARTRKGDRFLKLGLEAEEKKDYDSALLYLDQALSTDSQEASYLLAEQRVRFKAAQGHNTLGKKLQSEQKLEEALVEFQKAFLADPSSQISVQQIRDTTAMIRERSAVPAGTVILTPAEKARQAVERRISSLESPPELQPISNQISALKINNQPAHVLYETVGKLAGINVLFDPQGYETSAGKPYNLDVNNATLEEALNYVALETHTFWKAVSRNAIFVTQESDLKRQEYQDEVVKVFYVQNTSTPQEFQDIFNGVRTATGMTKGLFQVASQNAIVARASVDSMALLEKVIHDLDRPKAEVVVDVIVMDVDRNKSRTLGAALAGQTGGINSGIAFTPRNLSNIGGSTGSTGTGSTGSTGSTGTGSTGTSSTGTSTGTSSTGTSIPTGSTTGVTTGGTSTGSSNYVTLANVGHISSADFSVSLPGALVQALLSDSTTKVLQRPQVRATDGGKANLKIGSKIPYVSGSLNSAVATAGSIPYATTQFQQVDVGVQIDLQPHVNGPEDISMHIKVEVSSVTQTVSIAGVDQPVIGQRVNEAEIRMKDGEVSVLGGLSQDTQSNAISGIPGVVNIPVLGYFFGTRTKSRDKEDILIALIPHIVRATDYSAASENGVAGGTDRITKVIRRSTPVPIPSPAPSSITPPAALPVPSTPPLSPAPNTTAPPVSIPQPPAPASLPRLAPGENGTSLVTPAVPPPVVLSAPPTPESKP